MSRARRRRGRSYRLEAEERCREGWGVDGNWTFTHKEELKKRGFMWSSKDRQWAAPSAEARDKALEDLAATVVEPWTMTVYGDAGWKNGVARWAWYVRWAKGPAGLHEGFEEGDCPNINEGEARSLLDGLLAGLKHNPPPDDERERVVFMANDNMAVVNAIRERRHRFTESVDQLLSVVKDWGMRVQIKHVKGHQSPSASVQAWVNNRVDEIGNMRGR